MATNDILVFCPTDSGTNLPTQSAYAADAQRTNGNQPGVARSQLVNKALRQSSEIAAAVAQMIVDYTGSNVVDDGTTATILANLKLALASSVGTPGLMSLSAASAANVLTITIPAQILRFRKSTLTNGGYDQIPVPAQTIVVQSTSNLGMLVSGQVNKLIVLVANNGGTPVGCVVNQAGGVDLSENGVISPTTIGAASNSNTVIYSNASVGANSSYTVLGEVDCAFVTGTGWSAPTLVQPAGGQALAAMSSLGNGQKWQDMTGSRANGTTYYNLTGKPIQVQVYWIRGANTNAYITIASIVNGVTIDFNKRFFNTTDETVNTPAFVVPPGASYSVAQSGLPNTMSWAELR